MRNLDRKLHNNLLFFIFLFIREAHINVLNTALSMIEISKSDFFNQYIGENWLETFFLQCTFCLGVRFEMQLK